MSDPKEYYVTADSIATDSGTVLNKSLHVKDGRIEGFVDTKMISDRVMVLDYPGCTISPCFCDYHLHFFKDTAEYQAAAIGALISSGITKVYEGGDNNFVGLHAKKQLKDRLDIKVSGYAIYKQNTYGRYLGKGVASVREAGELMRQLKDEGVDYIKLVHSGIFDPSTGRITPGGFEKEELQDIVADANSLGLETACHANGEQAVNEAAEAGVSFIIHGLYVSKETLSLMAERGIKFIPTVNAFSSLTAISNDRQSMDNIQNAVDGHLAAIQTAFEKGVTILPGSDSGPAFIPYGMAYQNELALLQRAGLPLEYLLASASASPLAKGMRADFLVLKGLDVIKVFMLGACLD